jgi:hypothetical protein
MKKVILLTCLVVCATIIFAQGKHMPEAEMVPLDKTQMKVIAFSSEAASDLCKYVIDSDLNTHWHSHWYTATFPHWALIDLGAPRNIERIDIYRRMNTNYSDTKTVQCYVGDDFAYVNPTDGNKKIGEVVFSNTVGDNLRILNVAEGTDTNGRYLLLFLPDNNGRDSYVSLAEINVYTSKSTFIPSIEATQLNVFPNPVKDRLNIETDTPVKEIALIDLAGKIVLNTSIKSVGNHYQIDLSPFAQGIYFLRLSDGNHTYTKKIIKY